MLLLRHGRSGCLLGLLLFTVFAVSYWKSSKPEQGTRIALGMQLRSDVTQIAEGTKQRNNVTKFAKQEVWTRPSDMPLWAHKLSFLRSAEEIEDRNRICFVHVGKTAGSTMACNLGFLYDSCDGKQVKLPKGQLPLYSTNLIHNMYNDCADKHYNLFLFVVREPLARIESWFTYERVTSTTPVYNEKHFRQKQKLFMDCPFHTLNDLGGPLGLGAKNATKCSMRAWMAIKGTVGYYWHNHYNFEWYYNRVLDVTNGQKPRIAVIRTEHLEADWRSVEMEILNGPEPFAEDFVFSKRHSSEKRKDDNYLSPKSQANICKVLCNEILIYKRILQEAINLDESDYKSSLQDVVQRCPQEALSDSCHS